MVVDEGKEMLGVVGKPQAATPQGPVREFTTMVRPKCPAAVCVCGWEVASTYGVTKLGQMVRSLRATAARSWRSMPSLVRLSRR